LKLISVLGQPSAQPADLLQGLLEIVCKFGTICRYDQIQLTKKNYSAIHQKFPGCARVTRHHIRGIPGTHYRVISEHRNRQIETAVWNLAGFLQCTLETCCQRFGQFLNDFCTDFLNDFLYENINFLYKNLKFSRGKILEKKHCILESKWKIKYDLLLEKS